MQGNQVPLTATHSSLITIPNHPFNDLLRKFRYKVYYGGRGSGKSWAFAEALVQKAKVSSILILCVREYQNSITDSVHKLLKNTIHRLGLNAWFHITEKSIKSKAGAEFIFKGMHGNENGIKSTEGVDICWVEEAQTVSKTSWDALIPTIRKLGSEIWISFNPVHATDSTYKRFVLRTPSNSIVHHVNYDQNPFFESDGELSQERIDAYQDIINADNDREREQAQSDYDHVWLGACRELSSEIVLSGKCIEQDFADDLWKKATRPLLGADFGFSTDPNTLVKAFMLDSSLYIEREAYGVGVELNEMKDFYLAAIPDANRWPIKADCARPETISMLRGEGFLMSAADKWSGSVEDGVAHLRGFKKIIVHSRCRNFLMESRAYRYKRDRLSGEVLPIFIDKHNHLIDALRYSLDGYIQRKGDLGIWQRLAKR